MSTLLAIDLGLKAGFATFSSEGKLLRYRSTNFGKVSRLKSAAWNLLKEEGPPEYLVLEGDRHLAGIWSRCAERMGTSILQVSPETWRKELLLPRERRSGQEAKEAADGLARDVISLSGAPAPRSLRHDAAEAILIGLWGVLQVGWLEELPESLR